MAGIGKAIGNRRLLMLPAAVLAAVAGLLGAAPPAPGADASGLAALRRSDAVPAALADPSSLVDPFVGTAAGGNTFPGATVPFGMTQPSPATTSRPSGGDYAYGDSKIEGFAATHVSGPGCPALGHVSLMPVTGNVTSTRPASYASKFSHRSETARPGYYGVTLARYGVRAEMTATQRTAWERYTFPGGQPSGAPGTVLLNLGDAQGATTAARLAVTGPDTVAGFQSTRVFCNPGYRPVTVYFTARFSHRFAATGTWDDGPVTWGSTSARGMAIGGAFRFAGNPRQVTVSIGVSYVSAGNAARNLAAETPKAAVGASAGAFDAVERRAHATWRQWLNRAAVSGGTRAQQLTYYTALYHALIEPNVFSDVNGQYFGMDGEVHTAAGRVEYTNLSLWDTYRTQQELLDLIAPRVARDVVLSIISDTTELGWVPRWVLANEETNTMSGDSVTEFFADALAARLVTPAEVSVVYPYLKANATRLPPAGSQADGREGIGDYRGHGYVPFTMDGAYDQRSGASATLEYALADCSLAHVAQAAGQPGDAADFGVTAHNYRTEFDARTGFFRPRTPDGSFMTPFDPSFLSLPYITADAAGFDEGSAWQYLWLVPQDAASGPVSLARLLGGDSATIVDLDQFFAFGRVAADPGSASTVWTTGGQYDPGNEVDLQAPYTYNYLGAPWHTQAVVRAALTVYRPVPGGLPGNDDLGEMSAWYVMSALGLYPYAAGQGVYTLTTPLFPRAVLQLPRPFYSGRPLTISAPDGGRYIQGLFVNGEAHPETWIPISALAGGATLAYRTGAQPDPGWAAGPYGAPPPFCAG